MKKIKFLLLALSSGTLLFLGVLSCELGGDPLQPAKKLLYLIDNFAKAVFVIEGVTTVDGTIQPSRTITGEKTLLEDPTSIAVDPRRDILYVGDASTGNVTVYAPASEKDGDINPTRILPTPGTLPNDFGINDSFQVDQPGDGDGDQGALPGNIQLMSLDFDNDILFVFNAAIFAIQSWDNVSTRDEDFPDRAFTINFLPTSMFYDGERDLLYLGDSLNRDIKVFSEASTLIGDFPPAALIFDSENPFDRVNALTLNVLNDFLYMANGLVPQINVFLMASELNGDSQPDRVIEGDQTGLTDELLHLKFIENILYLLQNFTQVAVWDNGNDLDGNVAPNRLITVDGATRILSFDIDLQH